MRGHADGANSQLRRLWWQFRRDRLALAGLVFLSIVAVAAIVQPWIRPYEPAALNSGRPLQGPSWAHWLGTDELGRDVFSRILEGATVSMRFSVLTVACALVIALPLGLISGYVGGWVDNVVMRVMDSVMSIPALVLAIAIVAALGPDLTSSTIAIGTAMVPGFTRLVRGQALTVREEPFVEASRSIGTHTRTTLWKHLLPNVLSPLIVQVSIVLGVTLLAEASLSYLGLGAQPPTASWGSMLQSAQSFVFSDPWLIFPPGVAIAICVLAFNMVGDGLRSALGTSPATRRHGRLGLTSVTEKDRPGITAPPESDQLLHVDGLTVDFEAPGGRLRILDGVTFSVGHGETLGLVGESGSGKSVTALSIMRLLPSPPALISEGSVWFNGVDLLGLPFPEMAALRGNEMAMIFQDPMASLNPAMRVVDQVSQVVRWHEGLPKEKSRRRALEALDHVGIPARRATAYPHQFSGGMRQRAMIAMALVCRPKLIIADEPTTALDVTIQAQVLELLKSLRDEIGMSMIFVTHDLGVVADICDRVAVMYAGQIVETAPVDEFFRRPHHPYSNGLLRATPQQTSRESDLYVIPGQVPSFRDLGGGCRLVGRCEHATDACREERILLRSVGPEHVSRCVLADDPVLERT